MAKASERKASRIRGYAELHLAELCRDYTQLSDDIQEIETHPSRNEGDVARLPMKRELRADVLVMLRRVANDLQT